MNKTSVCIIGFIMMITSVVRSAPVPDTGQIKCYDVAGQVIICPSPGQALYGQDANHTINPISYTKLDGSGNMQPDSATSWVMVKDNITGLIWEMKTGKDGVKNYDDPHDADNTYTWYDSNSDTNGGDSGTAGNGTDTEDFIKALNDARYGGYSDWRLPNFKELAYIVNFNIPSPGPMIDTGYFPDTQAFFYWSANSSIRYAPLPLPPETYVAWGVDFNKYGGGWSEKHTSAMNYDSSRYVRAVRGGHSGTLSNYTDNGDGTVTDTSTGLTWQQIIPDESMSWEEALSYCEMLNLGNYTDWRLPTVKELQSLVDFSLSDPAINPTFFPYTDEYFCWSSTTNAFDTYDAWGMGYGSDGFVHKYDDEHVRAVRGGQAVSLDHSVLSVSPASRTLAKDAGEIIFSVSNTGSGDMPWTAAVTSGGSWLMITSGAGGSNTGNITCAFDANTSTSARTGTIRVTATGTAGSPEDVMVIQASIPTLIPATGQTKCYDVAGNVIPCPSSGQSLYGQDANYAINRMSYTKLDGSGNALPDSATSWVMVRDNITGLVWEMKTNMDTVVNYNDPHDADNPYTWYDSNPANNGGNAGRPGDGTDTEDFIKALNDAYYGGYSDWRLPTIKELIYIVNYSIPRPGPTINTGYFPNTQTSSYYWSSTNAGDSARYLHFNSGSVYNYYEVSYKYYKYYVRAVRGGQSGSLDAVDGGSLNDGSTAAGSYTDNGDGTVTDTSSGLTWEQAGSSNKTWEQALAYCEDLNLGGKTDWRLPTIKELHSLVDNSRSHPTINTTYFRDTISFTDISFYWSSTTDAYNTNAAWGVDFSNGGDGYSYKHYGLYVRAVRGGRPTLTDASPVYRFYNTNGGGYFYTINEDEKDAVIQSYKMFTYDGIGLYAFPTAQQGTLPVYRFNNNGGGYFYTINEDEKDAVIQYYSNWFTYEGIGFYAFPTAQQGTLPVYRFNINSGEYFYTINEDEKNAVIQNYSSWFTYEGVGFYAYLTPTPINANFTALPDIKANGKDGEITVTSGTTVSVMISLAPGDQNGKSADWWFAMDSPWDWYFLTTSGWNQIPIPLYQSFPLSDFSDQKMIEDQLPVGDYEFFFGVYITPNDTANSPLYMDSVKVHVVN